MAILVSGCFGLIFVQWKEGKMLQPSLFGSKVDTQLFMNLLQSLLPVILLKSTTMKQNVSTRAVWAVDLNTVKRKWRGSDAVKYFFLDVSCGRWANPQTIGIATHLVPHTSFHVDVSVGQTDIRCQSPHMDKTWQWNVILLVIPTRVSLETSCWSDASIH